MNQELHLKIEGMHCGSCVARVRSALLSCRGVVEVQINLASGSAVVSGEDSISEAELTTRLADSGYQVSRQSLQQNQDLTLDEAQYRRQLQAQWRVVWQAAGVGGAVLVLDGIDWLLGAAHGEHPLIPLLQALLCVALLLLTPGRLILHGGWRAVLRRQPDMDLLISLGIITALAASLWGLGNHSANLHHFHAVVMIVALVNVGRYLELRARLGVADSVSALMRRMPRRAWRWQTDQWMEISVEEIQLGDRLRVAEDMLVPVDGRIVEGVAIINESVITGEFLPVTRQPGDQVYGGANMIDGVMVIEATALGENSTLGQILQAVHRAQSSQTQMQRLADQVAGWFVPLVVALAGMTWLGWGLLIASDGWVRGLQSAIAVLVIACPCALGLATPMVVYIATGRAALKGILVRNAAALERLGRVDMLLFDKTGTLTTGVARVVEIVGDVSASGEVDERTLLSWAAAVEQYSQHPLGRAIVAEARRREINWSAADQFENITGAGATAVVEGQQILIGSQDFLVSRDVHTEALEPRFRQMTSVGYNVVWLAAEGRTVGLIGLADQPREGASQAIEQIQKMGIETMMVTGDHLESAVAVAGAVGIQRVRAEIAPGHKATIVQELQNRGRRVAFVGDGVNDAPAISQAEVGIAFATGTDVANQAARLSLVSDSLLLIPEALQIGRRSLAIIRQNLFWAFFYNLLTLPLAAIGVIPAWVAPAAMMFSSLSVVLNSLRLKNL
ncbi:MAG: putative copper-importing P-type ATPase A [Phycisphaerae bacterium]|nr:putative copper-importing P-type ATPase A [Phycisphaerae bacterium]